MLLIQMQYVKKELMIAMEGALFNTRLLWHMHAPIHRSTPFLSHTLHTPPTHNQNTRPKP